MTVGVIVTVAVLAAASGVGVAWRRRSGRLRPRTGDRLTAADVGAPLGPQATLVQFSTTFCAPCRATRRMLADIAGTRDGVTHVDIDAADRLDLTRRLGIYTTPTVLVLDGDGRVALRASGQPRKADVIAALDALRDHRVPSGE